MSIAFLRHLAATVLICSHILKELLKAIDNGSGQECFLAKFIKHLRLYQQTTYTELTASLWLSLRIQVYFIIDIYSWGYIYNLLYKL